MSKKQWPRGFHHFKQNWRNADAQPASRPKPNINYLSKWSTPLPETPLLSKAELVSLVNKYDSQKDKK